MLSGVGVETELKQLGIPCIQDLPVGKFMVDHISHFGINYSIEYEK